MWILNTYSTHIVDYYQIASWRTWFECSTIGVYRYLIDFVYRFNVRINFTTRSVITSSSLIEYVYKLILYLLILFLYIWLRRWSNEIIATTVCWIIRVVKILFRFTLYLNLLIVWIGDFILQKKVLTTLLIGTDPNWVLNT